MAGRERQIGPVGKRQHPDGLEMDGGLTMPNAAGNPRNISKAIDKERVRNARGERDVARAREARDRDARG